MSNSKWRWKSYKPWAQNSDGWQNESSQNKVRRTCLEIILDGSDDEADTKKQKEEKKETKTNGTTDEDEKMEDKQGKSDKPESEESQAANIATLEACLAVLGDTEAQGEKGLRKSLQARINSLKAVLPKKAKSTAMQLDREEKRLVQLEEDIAKAQRALKTKKDHLEKEKLELAKLRDALLMLQPSSAMSATAQLAELEKQELE